MSVFMLPILHRVMRTLTNVVFVPIRVFVFHQVSDEFDEMGMWKCDWTNTEQFKANVQKLHSEYTFISLEDAYTHLRTDNFCFKKYAVLTADDGWSSLFNIIPWLSEQDIPITLFLNPYYLDGYHKQERSTEKLFTTKDIWRITDNYPNVSIAIHGWTHKKCTEMTENEFIDGVVRSIDVLKDFPNFIPFYAFTYGFYQVNQLKILQKHHLVPVLVDSMRNCKRTRVVHRECIDGIAL